MTLNFPSPAIYLIHGFMGFGKTTYAKKLARELNAIRYTHDEIMLERYGKTPSDFQTKYKIVDDDIWHKTAQNIHAGKSVILDYGFWSSTSRQTAYQKAKELTPNVLFYALNCSIKTARHRVLERTKNDSSALYIDETCFNERLKLFEPLSEIENLPVQFINTDNS